MVCMRKTLSVAYLFIKIRLYSLNVHYKYAENIDLKLSNCLSEHFLNTKQIDLDNLIRFMFLS